MFQLLRLATQQLAFGDESKCPFSRSRPTRPRSVPKHGLGQRVQDAGAIAGPTREAMWCTMDVAESVLLVVLRV
jgi:hypothetical protein